ncbi:cytochrome c family protein [Nereida sp. MMG025]|uniref:c-type cytochrome n=1 Tax=Nereida sp. MMG025 TaxID=2909981 RepID=UPI001F469BC1|nr:cytochrome c family protein [Nereida sp. MMG025]MCF6444296.1 cytochrome c family protein [Nereida sp. MMG025]
MDTMTFTKVLGGLCGSLLVFLLGAWAAEELYHTGGGHGYGEEQQAYVIPVEGDDAAEEEVVQVSFEEVYANADASAASRIWRQCAACHKIEDGANGTGPHLYNVVGREKGAVDGYNYSGALVAVGGAWTPENLNGFLENPREYAPGTAMAYRGLADIEDRANLIAYLAANGAP